MDTPAHADWRDEDLVLISAIEHWSYCPRQCGLIHLEQTYDENIFTLRGRRSHEHAHRESVGTEDGIRVQRGATLWSDRLGLIGKSDVLEWHGTVPFPIEYKVGKHRGWQHETLQLCAQAMCLEEMTGVPVLSGAIWSVGSRRRRTVSFTADHRERVERIVVAIRTMLRGVDLPDAVDDARCTNCSLIDACKPAVTAHPISIQMHYRQLFSAPDEAT